MEVKRPILLLIIFDPRLQGIVSAYPFKSWSKSSVYIQSFTDVIVESASGFRQIVDTQVLDLEATTLPSVLYINLPYDDCTFLDGNNEDGTMGVCERTATGSSATSTFTGDVVAFATITATVQDKDDDDNDDDNATQTNGVGCLTPLAVGNLGVLGMVVMIIVNTIVLTM